MKYPTLQQLSASRQMVEVFGGYNRNLRIGDGEWYDMQNMTSDFYPVLSPRGKRGVWLEGDGLNGMISNGGLCYIDGSMFVLPDENRTQLDLGLQEGIKTMVSMGAYVIILPDKKWINVAQCMEALEQGEQIPSDAFGAMEAHYTGGATFELCQEDGTLYEKDSIANWKPTDPADGQLWMDGTETDLVLKKWAKEASMWVEVSNVYTRVTISQNPFEKGDTVDISGFEETGFLRNVTGLQHVVDVGIDKEVPYIVIKGKVWGGGAGLPQLTITRTVPDMDFVVESGNRLWGCKCGITEKGFLNELYASKLGDFKNWNSFQGVSTDSYVASVGADGPFTGAISYQGRPVFFKESCITEVYGAYPAQYQVQTTPCEGVQVGCEYSLAIVNNVLFYKSRTGICAFDGSLPVQVGQALGTVAYDNAVAGCCGDKYYISMRSVSADLWNLFVYDTAKGLWHREDTLQVLSFCSYQNELYGISEDRSAVLTMTGSGIYQDPPVEWMVQSGDIGLSLPDMKYLSRLTVRMSLEENSEVSFYVQYDFEEEWEHVCTVPGTSLRSFDIPIRPKRSDYMKLRIEGIGGAKIYSITKTIEQGSDIS